MSETVLKCEEACKLRITEAIDRERASLADVLQTQVCILVQCIIVFLLQLYYYSKHRLALPMSSSVQPVSRHRDACALLSHYHCMTVYCWRSVLACCCCLYLEQSTPNLSSSVTPSNDSFTAARLFLATLSFLDT